MPVLRMRRGSRARGRFSSTPAQSPGGSRTGRSRAPAAEQPTAGTPSRTLVRPRRCARRHCRPASIRCFRPIARRPFPWSPRTGPRLPTRRSPWRSPSVGAVRAHQQYVTGTAATGYVRPDRGSQYTSVAFGARCKEAGVRPSTGLVGDAYDNAMCESFFATLECELIDRRRFRFTARRGWPSFSSSKASPIPQCRHFYSWGYLSPIEYERTHDGLSKPA